MAEIVFTYQLILPKRNNPQKWSLPLTNYFFILTLNLTLFLVERGSSIDSVDFFFLALVGFFSVFFLSLAVGLSSSMEASNNTCKFLWATTIESASVMPLASCSETGNLCSACRGSGAAYEGVEPFLPSQGYDCSHP
jgi:hypothetical protein